jgi:hypothetical protein
VRTAQGTRARLVQGKATRGARAQTYSPRRAACQHGASGGGTPRGPLPARHTTQHCAVCVRVRVCVYDTPWCVSVRPLGRFVGLQRMNSPLRRVRARTHAFDTRRVRVRVYV